MDNGKEFNIFNELYRKKVIGKETKMDFKFKKKEKEKTESVPKKKGIQTKGVKRVVMGGLVLVLFSGVGAYIKAGAVSNHISKVEKSVVLLKMMLTVRIRNKLRLRQN